MRTDILGVERRRRWTRDEKARLVAETLAPDACVSSIARRHDVAPSLLFTWRRQTRVSKPEPLFLPVQVAAEEVPAPTAKRSRRRRSKMPSSRIEIDLGSGRRLTVGADVDAAALARVLDVLERR
jgi:transposase